MEANPSEVEKLVKIGLGAKLKKLTVGGVIIEFGDGRPDLVPVFVGDRPSDPDQDVLVEPTEDELLFMSSGHGAPNSRSEAPA